MSFTFPPGNVENVCMYGICAYSGVCADHWAPAKDTAEEGTKTFSSYFQEIHDIMRYTYIHMTI